MIPAGSLQDFTLSDLIQIMSLNGSTGTLFLDSEGREGALSCNQGELVGARAGDQHGEEAVYTLFDWLIGTFRFEDGKTDVLPANIATPLGELAKEGIRRLDQWRTIRSELPRLTSRALLRRAPAATEQPTLTSAARELDALLDFEHGQTLGQLALTLRIPELIAAQRLLELHQAGVLHLESAPEVAIRSTFKQVSEGIFSRFAGISGLKMIQGLEDHLNELARERAWEIRWKNGQISDGLATLDENVLLSIYRDCLADQWQYVGKIHGLPFLERALDQIASLMSAEERASLSLLGLQPVGS